MAAEGIPVRLTCGVLGFSAQGDYKWLCSPLCRRDLDDAHLVNAIVEIHRDDPEFGYRLISDELEAAGHQASENRVHRLCREHKIGSRTTKKGRRGAGKLPGAPVSDEPVPRVFSASEPDELWLTDIAEHPTAEGKLYCCCLEDVFSNRNVGDALGDPMTAAFATSALRSVIAQRQSQDTLVVHSDRGGYSRSRAFHALGKVRLRWTDRAA